MSKPDLLTNMKFRRLLKATGLPRPLLVGHLEMLWTTAHVSKPIFFDAEDVELAADWEGEPGQFAAHLLKHGFLDDTDGGLAIHDYWDHAPEYVKRRERRRRKKAAMSAIDRPVTDTAPPVEPTGTGSVKVRDTSVPVRETSERLLSNTPTPKSKTHPKTTDFNKEPSPAGVPSSSGTAYRTTPSEPPSVTSEPRTTAAFLSKVEQLTDEPAWHGWWREVLLLLERKDKNLDPLWDALDYVGNRTDPVMCAARQQAPLKEPMSYLSREAARLCHKRRLYYPKFPKCPVTKMKRPVDSGDS